MSHDGREIVHQRAPALPSLIYLRATCHLADYIFPLVDSHRLPGLTGGERVAVIEYRRTTGTECSCSSTQPTIRGFNCLAG